jgi:hypothetical protein
MWRVAIYCLLIGLSVGCDGIYRYHYDGHLCDASGIPVSGRWIAVDSAANRAAPTTMPLSSGQSVNSAVQTDVNGYFAGTFTTWTGWVFALRPPPPRLNAVRVLYLESDRWHGLITALGAAQANSGGEAHLHLGKVTIPTNAPCCP